MSFNDKHETQKRYGFRYGHQKNSRQGAGPDGYLFNDYRGKDMVEPDGIEPTTSCLQSLLNL